MNNQNGLFNDRFLDMASVVGLAISIYNLILLSNDDDSKEVKINRSKLDEQNDEYLETIIEQNNKIINLLKGG